VAFDNVKSELGFQAAHRDVIDGGGDYALREPDEPYGLSFASKHEALRTENTFIWNESIDEVTT
jgi:hypothetical protein